MQLTVYQNPNEALLAGYEGQNLERQVQRFIASTDENTFITNNLDETFRLSRSQLSDDSDFEVIRMRSAIVYSKPPWYRLPRNRKRIDQEYEHLEQRFESGAIQSHKILLHNTTTGQTKNLVESLPKTCELFETGPECERTNYYSNSSSQKINVEKISEYRNIATLFHEVGHAWDDYSHPDELSYSITVSQLEQINDAVEQDTAKSAFAESKINSERNAWAWALKIARRLRDTGFLSNNQLQEVIADRLKYCLSTYDQAEVGDYTENFFADNMRYLHRKLETAQHAYEKLDNALTESKSMELHFTIANGEDIFNLVIRHIQSGGNQIVVDKIKFNRNIDLTHDKYVISDSIFSHKKIAPGENGDQPAILTGSILKDLARHQAYPVDPKEFEERLSKAMELADCISQVNEIANYVADQCSTS